MRGIKNSIWLLLVAMLLLVACGSGNPEPAAPADQGDTGTESIQSTDATDEEPVATDQSGDTESSEAPTTDEGTAADEAPSTDEGGTPAGEVPTLGDDAVTTDSGLMYEEIAMGDGAPAEAGMLATVHYTGWLENGTQFDSSVMRGEPFSFPLGRGQVIPGWDEGVQGMQVGGKRLLKIPSDLAYGDQGAGAVIPAGATLIFEVELLDVEELPPVPEAPADVDAYEETENGVEYAILEAGDGEIAEAGDLVSVQYTGWLEDGTRFDSSLLRGQAFTFPLGVGQVIPGWDEGVQGMLVGEKRQLRIPSDMAYGEQGIPGSIPPNSTLIFDIELQDLQKQ